MLRSCLTARYGPTSIVVVDKVDKKAVVRDVAVPDDSNVRKKEHEKTRETPGSERAAGDVGREDISDPNGHWSP